MSRKCWQIAWIIVIFSALFFFSPCRAGGGHAIFISNETGEDIEFKLIRIETGEPLVKLILPKGKTAEFSDLPSGKYIVKVKVKKGGLIPASLRFQELGPIVLDYETRLSTTVRIFVSSGQRRESDGREISDNEY